MSTSCGYPHNLRFRNKKEFFEDARAPGIIDSYWDSLPYGTRVPIWTCSQKIEIRDVSKLREANHRTFTAAPVEHSVNCNRMCLDANNKFYDGHNKTWSFVGATKFLQGWDSLYRRLNKHPHAFELDESQFDSSLFAKAMFGQVDIRFSFYHKEDQTDENYRRLRALYDAIVNSVIVLENGELIQKHTGNPSGSSNTIVDNTMILFRLFSYAWIQLCKEQQVEPTYVAFMENVEAALNGDDNSFTTSEAVVSWFNPRNIARIWSSIGVITKTPCEDPRKLSDISFLSQEFSWDDGLGIWLPKPEAERVLCSLAYASSLDDVRWHLLRACALRLDSYGNEECRATLSEYITYLYDNYSSQLVGVVEKPGVFSMSIEEIKGVWKSDAWIEALYSGQESKSDCFSSVLLKFLESEKL